MNFTNSYYFSEANKATWARELNRLIEELVVLLNGNLDSDNFTSTTLTGKYCTAFLFDSHLIDEEIFGIFYLPNNASITKIMLFIGETADQNIQVDICKNDVEQNKIATLSANTVSELTTLGSQIDFLSTDKLSLKIKSCGSDSQPGQSLTAVIYWSA